MLLPSVTLVQFVFVRGQALHSVGLQPGYVTCRPGFEYREMLT